MLPYLLIWYFTIKFHPFKKMLSGVIISFSRQMVAMVRLFGEVKANTHDPERRDKINNN